MTYRVRIPHDEDVIVDELIDTIRDMECLRLEDYVNEDSLDDRYSISDEEISKLINKCDIQKQLIDHIKDKYETDISHYFNTLTNHIDISFNDIVSTYNIPLVLSKPNIVIDYNKIYDAISVEGFEKIELDKHELDRMDLAHIYNKDGYNILGEKKDENYIDEAIRRIYKQCSQCSLPNSFTE